jgi:hypothetical protein
MIILLILSNFIKTMVKIDQYLNKRALIVGDVNSGKTDRTLELLQLFLKAGYAQKIAVLDLAPGTVQGIGGKMEPPPDQSLLYLTATISAPRLMGKDANHTRQLAQQNARTMETLFKKLVQKQPEILFVNDVTLYLQAGHLQRLLEILNTTSTQIINAYYGTTFADSELTRRERKLTEDLMKTCDHVITMKN